MYHAYSPEHLRASRTFYRPKLPLAKTQVVPLRTTHLNKFKCLLVRKISYQVVFTYNEILYILLYNISQG